MPLLKNLWLLARLARRAFCPVGGAPKSLCFLMRPLLFAGVVQPSGFLPRRSASLIALFSHVAAMLNGCCLAQASPGRILPRWRASQIALSSVVATITSGRLLAPAGYYRGWLRPCRAQRAFGQDRSCPGAFWPQLAGGASFQPSEIALLSAMAVVEKRRALAAKEHSPRSARERRERAKMRARKKRARY